MHQTYDHWAAKDPELAAALAYGDTRFPERVPPDLRPPWKPDIDIDPEASAAFEELVEAYERGDITDPEGDGDHRTEPEITIRVEFGGNWILDAPEGIPAVWGHEDEVLWPEGEGLIIASPPGVGKTTLATQLVFGRLGLNTELLGYPIAQGERVLYLAMDRPRQIQRAFARLALPQHRDVLNDRLVVWTGPPPKDLAKHPDVLAYLANSARADTVFLDSLKDAAIGLSDDEVGAGLNQAIQINLAEGIETASLHHQRKGQGGQKPRTLEDLYGSTWIAAGAGSVLLLWGQAGDAIVELTHLKPPSTAIGPLKLEHDHDTGRTIIHSGFDLLAYLRNHPKGVAAAQAARQRYQRDPTESEIRNERRRLDRLVAKKLAHKEEGSSGGIGGGEPARWYPIETRREGP